MNDTLVRLYHRLPAPLQSVAASLRGLSLRSWRYGPEAERLVEEALEREQWCEERWKSWQEERLGYILHRAVTCVPYYREQWAARRRRGDRASWEYLENWPILQKEPLRQNPKAFVADDCDIRRMYHEHTSGTTGTPLELWLSRETVRAWFALLEARLRRWNDVSRYQKWAILGGQLVVPAARQRPPFWVWNGPMNQLYLSGNHISRQNTPAYLDALQRHRVTHMIAYSSSAAILARETIDLGLSHSCTGLRVVLTNAEPLFPWQREAILEGFRCEVRETYGMAEVVSAASECAARTMHLWPEVGRLEVLCDAEDLPVPPGSAGRLVATGLLNADMPLVRYAVGDRVSAAIVAENCGCSRTLPTISSIEGRIDDLVYTRDGRRIGRLDPVFKAHLPVREAQIIQEALDQVRVRYVPTADFTHEAGRSIIERLKARMGAVEVILERVDEVPRTANGKFRAVVCKLSPEQRNLLPEPDSKASPPPNVQSR